MTNITEERPEPGLASRVHSALQDHNVLLLGAPAAGKTSFLTDALSIDVVSSLSNLNPQDESPMTLDPFFDLYLEYDSIENERLRETFVEVLQRSSGLCLSLTPYEFQWLVQEAEPGLDMVEMERFEVFSLRFTEADAQQEARSIDDDLQGGEFQVLLNRCVYEFEFSAALSPTGEAYTYKTYLPYLLTEISIGEEDEMVLPRDLLEQSVGVSLHGIKQFAKEFAIAEGVNHIKELLNSTPEAIRSIQGEKLLQLSKSSLLASAPAVAPAVISLTIALALVDDDGELSLREQYEHQLGPLLTDNTVSASRELLERELKAPPGALTAVQAARSQELQSRIKYVHSQVDALDVTTNRLEESIDALTADLEEQKQSVSLIQNVVDSSVASLDEGLGESLRVNEQRILRYDELTDEEFRSAPMAGDHVEETVKSIRQGNRFTVITGPHGSGKSTVLYKVGRQLQKEGTTVLVPDIRHGNFDFEAVKQGLRARDESRTVLMVAYQEGPQEMSVRSDDQISYLFTLLDDGYCDAIVVESRIELLEDFMTVFRRTQRSKSVTSVQEHPEIIRCTPLANPEITRIADWTSRLLTGNSLPDDQLNKIVAVAEGIPEIAKISSRVLATGGTLEGVQAADDVIWRDLQPLRDHYDRQSGGRRLLQNLATFRSLTEDELLQFQGDHFDKVDLDEIGEELEGYIHREEDGDETRWRLRPDVYTDVLFRRECFTRVATLVEVVISNGSPETVSRVFDSLALLYQTARSQNVRDRNENVIDQQRVVDTAEELFALIEEHGETDLYLESLSRIGQIPVDITSIDTRLLTEADGTHGLNLGIKNRRIDDKELGEVETEGIDSTATDSLEIIARLVTNYMAEYVNEDQATVESFITDIISDAQNGPGPVVDDTHLNSLVRVHTYSHSLDIHYSRLSDPVQHEVQEVSNYLDFYERALIELEAVAEDYGVFIEDPLHLLTVPFQSLPSEWEIQHIIETYDMMSDSIRRIASNGEFIPDRHEESRTELQDTSQFSHDGTGVHHFIAMSNSIPILHACQNLKPDAALALYRYVEPEVNSLLSQYNKELEDVIFDVRERGLARFNGLMIWGLSWMYPDPDAKRIIKGILSYLEAQRRTPNGPIKFLSISIGEAVKFLVNTQNLAVGSRLISTLGQRSQRAARISSDIGMELSILIYSQIYHMKVYTSILDVTFGFDFETADETERFHRRTYRRLFTIFPTIVSHGSVPYIIESTYDRGMNRFGAGGLSMLVFQGIANSGLNLSLGGKATPAIADWVDFLSSYKDTYLRAELALRHALVEEEKSVEETAEWVSNLLRLLQRLGGSSDGAQRLLSEFSRAVEEIPELEQEVKSQLK